MNIVHGQRFNSTSRGGRPVGGDGEHGFRVEGVSVLEGVEVKQGVVVGLWHTSSVTTVMNWVITKTNVQQRAGPLGAGEPMPDSAGVLRAAGVTLSTLSTLSTLET